MPTDKGRPKLQVSYYGKKVYYLTAFIPKTTVPTKKEPSYIDENIEEDNDR